MSYAGPAGRAKRAPDATRDNQPASRSTAASSRPTVLDDDDSSDSRSGPVLFATGVALGVVVGAGIALLLAPQAGSDTRRAITRRSRRIGQRGHDAWDDLRIEFRRALRRRLAARTRRHAEDPDAA